MCKNEGGEKEVSDKRGVREGESERVREEREEREEREQKGEKPSKNHASPKRSPSLAFFWTSRRILLVVVEEFWWCCGVCCSGCGCYCVGALVC